MPIVIKRIETEEEIKERAYVHWCSWREEYKGIVNQSFLDKLLLKDFEAKVRDEIDTTFIAKDGEHVVGFVYYCKCRDNDLQNFGEVGGLYISSNYYGQKVGYRLMQAALEQLKIYPQVALWVLKENERAITFYKKCGFSFDGTEKILNLVSPVIEVRMVAQNPYF